MNICHILVVDEAGTRQQNFILMAGTPRESFTLYCRDSRIPLRRTLILSPLDLPLAYDITLTVSNNGISSGKIVRGL